MQLVSLLIKKMWPLWLNMEIRYAVRDHYIHIDPSQCLLSIRSGWKAWIHGNDKYLAFAMNLSDCHDFSQMLHFCVKLYKFLALKITIFTSNSHLCHYLEPWYLLINCLASNVICTTFDANWFDGLRISGMQC